MEKNPINMIISSSNVALMFGQRSRRCSNDSINQTLGHPHCDNNYATLFVECRLCIYVGPNYGTIIY